MSSDAKARARALDPTQSFIVQAPAGSGKTELLIQRFLTLLARVEQPENVVAITFTRKAAGEMRRRVLDALVAAAGPRPEKEHAARTWELARAVSERDRANNWELFANSNRLRIRTIDSLSSSLARQMPWLSRLGAPLEPVEEADDLYAEAARLTIEALRDGELSEALRTLLLHLDNDYRKVQEMLAGMLARRDQWARHVFGAAPGDDVRAVLEQGLRNAIADRVDDVRALFPAGALAVIEDAGACLPDDEDAEGWRGVRDLLLTQTGEWRKRVKHPALKDLIDSWQERDDLREALAGLAHLPDGCYSEPQWKMLCALLELLPRAVGHLRVLFGAKRQCDFTEIALAALQALEGDGAPTDLALSLDYRVEHLLVDEFQDTSVTQWRLLSLLTAGWEAGDGRTLFVVGDPMQSIYRFREAEVGLFLKAAREGLGEVRLEPLQLSANFRSDKGVVDWVNFAFPHVLGSKDDLASGAVSFLPSEAKRDPVLDQAATIHAFAGRDDQAEAMRVVELVSAVRTRDNEAKIAILVRARSHTTAILPALRAAGHRYRAVGIEGLAAQPEVQDLSALTRALLHPADRIAWLAVLRAPWCGLSLADLYALAGGSKSDTLVELMADEARVAALSPDGRVRLERVRDVLEAALEQRELTPRALVEKTWLALGGPAAAGSGAGLANAQAFFALLDTVDTGAALDVEAFAARIERLNALPDPEADERLQVMSIHKAKGLEFDVVIVPGIGCKTGRDEEQLLLWLERPRMGGETDLLLAPVRAAGTKQDPVYKILKHIEHGKQQHEASRLLYVAATRARRELHLLGHARLARKGGEVVGVAPVKGSLLERLWPVVEPEYQRVFADWQPPEQAEPGERAIPPIKTRRLPSDWRLPLPAPAVAAYAEQAGAPAARATFDWVGERLRHVGSVTHALLHRIAQGRELWTVAGVEQQASAIRAALLELGVAPSDVVAASAQVRAAVRGALEDARGRWILSPHHAASATEYALTAASGGSIKRVRVDRTFIDEDGTRWVIDYKTSAHSGSGLDQFLDNERERHREQLEEYRRVFEKMEKRPVRAALYFPLLGGWRELERPAALSV